KLGLRWRGASLMALGLLVPVGYIVLSGGPGAQATERVAANPGQADGDASPKPTAVKPLAPAKPAAPAKPDDGITPLPSDDN
ncbi:MAG TPA: hypothetical protein VGC42_24050, partial [Kofleriaceae bacterium]